jgi:hypothetical protein
MDHPTLSIREFAEHFRRKMDDWGFEDRKVFSVHKVSGVVSQSGASGARLFLARSNAPLQSASYGPSSWLVDHAWG